MSQSRKEQLERIRDVVNEEISKIAVQEKKPASYGSLFEKKYEFAFGEDLEREIHDRERESQGPAPGARNEGDGWDSYLNGFRG